MCKRAGRVVNQLQLQFPGPCGNGIVVPFVGRQKIRRVFFIYSEPLHPLIVPQQVGTKLLLCYQQAVALCPIAIEQMFIAVCAEVMAVLLYFLNDGPECRVAVKPAGKKEGCLNPVLPKCGKNCFTAFRVFISREYNGQRFLCRITANDRAVGQRLRQRFFFTSTGRSDSLAASK